MVNEKDVMRKLKYFAGIAAALMLWGCSEDKFVPDQYLNGLGGDEYVLNEIDEWIIDNYTRPYNMEVKYRWDQSELDLNRTLVPIKEELAVSYTHLDVYKRQCQRFFTGYPGFARLSE